jgi:hypothetical protein
VRRCVGVGMDEGMCESLGEKNIVGRVWSGLDLASSVYIRKVYAYCIRQGARFKLHHEL